MAAETGTQKGLRVQIVDLQPGDLPADPGTGTGMLFGCMVGEAFTGSADEQLG